MHILQKLSVNKKIISQILLAFFIPFIFIPFIQLDYLRSLPGDLVDSRFNNYLLENVYLYLSGTSKSLVHLNFFYPFPYILGFSDNLFGSAPFYLVPRWLTGRSDIAFAFWYSFSYCLNFFSSYYVLRKFNFDRAASIAGAIIFSFSYPVGAQSGHVQLAYRFGVPLAVLYFIEFLKNKSFFFFFVCMFWLVWQFYCSIYIGFFLLLILFAIFISNIGIILISRERGLAEKFEDIVACFPSFKMNKRKWLVSFGFMALILSTLILFFPYLKVSEIYGAKRAYAEISSMLPRVGSYFLMDASWLWSPISNLIQGVPMRHEQQIFIGATSLILVIIGLLVGSRKRNGIEYCLISTSLGLLFFLTLSVAGYSAWFYLSGLPLASAIRAMSRIILVMLFPISYLSGLALNAIPPKFKVFKYIFIAFLIFEFSTAKILSTPASKWRASQNEALKTIPDSLSKDSILFFAQKPGAYIPEHELDAMWAALQSGYVTMNGYSGNSPPAYKEDYGMDCYEALRRINSYSSLAHQSQLGSDSMDLIKRIVLIGFGDCSLLK